MTEKLKTLMDTAADQDFAAVDLDAITAAGDRTVRRRRLAVGVAGLAAAAVTAVGVAVLAGDDGHDRAGFASSSFETDVPMWTVDSTLHTPTETYDLGVAVLALARTTHGIAYLGEDDRIYSFDGQHAEQIGATTDEAPFLVGDTDGTLVGWVDGSGAKPAFVVHDLATGDQHRFDEHTDADRSGDTPLDAFFFAIDGTTAYWADGRGTVATDVTTGEATVLTPAGAPAFVVSAEDGTWVRWVEDRDGADVGTDVVGADGQVLLGHRDTETLGALSPDGRWAASLDGASVWEVSTGRRVAVRAGSPDALGYDWLDAGTLMVVADGPGDTARLLRCEVPAGACEETSTLDAESDERFALPAFGLALGLRSGGGEATGSSSSEGVECEVGDDGVETCTTVAPAEPVEEE